MVRAKAERPVSPLSWAFLKTRTDLEGLCLRVLLTTSHTMPRDPDDAPLARLTCQPLTMCTECYRYGQVCTQETQQYSMGKLQNSDSEFCYL